MLSAKIDQLMKKIEDLANEKQKVTFVIPAWHVKYVETLGI
jgi:hypothetical protein